MILPWDKFDKFIEIIGEGSPLLGDETRNFFAILAPSKYLLSFHWLDEKKVVAYATTSVFVVVTDSESVAGYASPIDDDIDGILQLHQFLLEMTSSDIYRLQSLENMIVSLEDLLFLDTTPSANGFKDITKDRKDVLKMKRYYEQMELLTDEMAGVDPSFGFISHKFTKLLGLVQSLQSYVESVRSAYQSQIDIEQNNIMKLFTVITTIFTPLTLLTSWYGMNLNLPEYDWPWSYPMVIVLSLVISVGLLVVFRKKGWF